MTRRAACLWFAACVLAAGLVAWWLVTVAGELVAVPDVTEGFP